MSPSKGSSRKQTICPRHNKNSKCAPTDKKCYKTIVCEYVTLYFTHSVAIMFGTTLHFRYFLFSWNDTSCSLEPSPSFCIKCRLRHQLWAWSIVSRCVVKGDRPPSVNIASKLSHRRLHKITRKMQLQTFLVERQALVIGMFRFVGVRVSCSAACE